MNIAKATDLPKSAFESASNGFAILRPIFTNADNIDDFSIVVASKNFLELTQSVDYHGKSVRHILPDQIAQDIFDKCITTTRNGIPMRIKTSLSSQLPDEQTEFQISKNEDFIVLTAETAARHQTMSRQLTDSLPAIVWITQADGNCIYLNQHWYDYTGQTTEEAVGFGWLDATFPADKEAAGKIFMDANATQSPFSILYRLRTSNGEYRWCKDSGSPRFDADGVFNGFIGTVVDVHEEKIAEEKIRQSEERYRALFNSIDAGFCTIEVLFDEEQTPYNYRFLEINKAFEQQTGFTDAVGRTMNDFAKIEDFWYQTYGQVATTGIPVRFEHNAENLNRFYDVYAFKVGGRDDRKVGVLFNDITSRRNTEIAIRQSEKQFKDIAEAIPHLVWVCNTFGEVIYFNEKWYQFTGSCAGESLGHGWSSLLHPDDVSQALEKWNAAQANASVVAIEYRLQSADGGYRWVFSNGVPIKNSDGTIERWFGTCTDIHERKQAVEALRESEMQLAFAIEATELGVWDFTPETNRFSANERLKDWFGLHPNEEIDLATALAAVDENDRSRVSEAIQKALTYADSQYDIEYAVENKTTGRRRIVRAKGKASFDNGSAYRFNGTLLDVTDQAQSRARMEESESRFRALVNATSDVVYRMNNDWSEMRNLEGRGFLSDTGEPIQDWMEKYIHPNDRQFVNQAISSAIATKGTFELEHQVVDASGGMGWTFSRAIPILDKEGNIIEWFGAASDVTERKKTERALITSEENLRALVLQSPTGICVMDAASLAIEIVNDKFVEIAGKPHESLIGKHYWEPFAEAAACYANALQGVIDTGRAFYANDVALLLVRHGKEELVYVTFIYEPMKDCNGLVKKVVVWVLDNTAQVQARRKIEESENRYRILSEKLEQLVAERTRELQRSNEDLQQFAHVASHDLKEPVRKIKTFTNLLEEHLHGHTSDAVARYFEKIQTATNRMYTMIDGVLTYSTINETPQNPETVDLSEVIMNIESDLEVALLKVKGTIVHDKLPTIEGAPVLLYQLFYNLINNSIKFAKPDVPPMIKVSAGRIYHDEKYWNQITLQDNGIGFEQAYASRIFETFTRLNPKDRYEGTGLGLSLCKKIVERHQGLISAEGIPGKGASFQILFPES